MWCIDYCTEGEKHDACVGTEWFQFISVNPCDLWLTGSCVLQPLLYITREKLAHITSYVRSNPCTEGIAVKFILHIIISSDYNVVIEMWMM